MLRCLLHFKIFLELMFLSSFKTKHNNKREVRRAEDIFSRLKEQKKNEKVLTLLELENC